MNEMHYVIIGNGTCGNCAADVLREKDQKGRITIISDEPTRFVYRHNLTRFLREEKDINSYSVNSVDWYLEKNIHLRLNQPVVQVSLLLAWVAAPTVHP